MACTLVVNPGSSSKKYALYEDGTVRLRVRYERTPLGFERCIEIGRDRQTCTGVEDGEFGGALERVLALAQELRIIPDLQAIGVVVLRVVAPGTYFQNHHRIDEMYMKRLIAAEPCAPLHIPHITKEARAVTSLLPQAIVVGASDSAFHAELPPAARNYSIEPSLAAELDLYRYGYHGLSVASVIERFHAVTGGDPGRVVVCHLGSGVSVTGVENGRSVYTTMGFSPGSGLPMASRAGDLDASALLALMRARAWKVADAEAFIATRGGLHGMAGTPDLRLVIERATRGDSRCEMALDQYVQHIGEAIAAAAAALRGIDAVVFTATIGERSSYLRARIAAVISFLGARLDTDRNELAHSKDIVISEHHSPVQLVIIRTDEMGEMARVGSLVARGLSV
jgi:acetate kinase